MTARRVLPAVAVFCSLLADVGKAHSPDVRPVSVRVRQTPGGPRIHVDGRPVPPRAFYGCSPQMAFVAEVREYSFTLPFTVPVDAVRAEARIVFSRNPATFWLHDVELVDQNTGRVVALAGSMKDEAAFRRCWRVVGEGTGGTVRQEGNAVRAAVAAPPSGERRPFYLAGSVAGRLARGAKYRLRIPVRADHGRSFFNPYVVVYDAAGREHFCPLSYGDTLAETAGMAAEAGVDIVTFPAPTCWTEPERPQTWNAIDAVCRRLLQTNPKALLLPRVGMNAPAWFLDRHPEARMRFDDGFTVNMASVSHRPYRQAACAHLERLVRHLRETFPRNFAGVHAGGQNSAEWFYEKAHDPELGGCEVPVRDAFRAWLAHRGEKDAATAEVPSPEERRDASGGFLLDPVRRRRLVDFNRFRQEEMASLVSELGAAVRRGSDGQSLAVFFYGYSWGLGYLKNGAAASGHFALEWLLEHGRENIDALSAPYCYSNRRLPGSMPMMSPVETVERSGVLWFNEDDTRTYLEDVWDYKTTVGYSGITKEQTLDMLRRNVSFAILRGMGDWWMDLFGRGWYRDRDLWALRRELAPLERAMSARSRPYDPEIANVVDEGSFLHLACESRRVMAPLLDRRPFDGCGAPYGQYLLNDVLSRPVGAKMFVFALAAHLDAGQRGKIAALRRARPDAMFVWCWAPGYLHEGGASEDAIFQATGFRAERVSPRAPVATPTPLGLKRGLARRDWGGGICAGAAPLFAPVPSEGDEVWATWRDLPGKAALVVRRRADGAGSDVFLGPGEFSCELLNALARNAGVHCYLGCAAGNVAAAEGFVAVQNTTDRPLEVALRDGTRRLLRIPKGATRVLGPEAGGVEP